MPLCLRDPGEYRGHGERFPSGRPRGIFGDDIKRLEGKLEKIAASFKGIDKAFALQAGREIRIMIDPAKLNDDESIVLARDIRSKIEAEMEYPWADQGAGCPRD
ncbi:MAG: hypothetical protein U5N85_14155 [Arcicella sp.]|nr:hypothetical protein [Arcicella sp.]